MVAIHFHLINDLSMKCCKVSMDNILGLPMTSKVENSIFNSADVTIVASIVSIFMFVSNFISLKNFHSNHQTYFCSKFTKSQWESYIILRGLWMNSCLAIVIKVFRRLMARALKRCSERFDQYQFYQNNISRDTLTVSECLLGLDLCQAFSSYRINYL